MFDVFGSGPLRITFAMLKLACTENIRHAVVCGQAEVIPYV